MNGVRPTRINISALVLLLYAFKIPQVFQNPFGLVNFWISKLFTNKYKFCSRKILNKTHEAATFKKKVGLSQTILHF